MKRLPAVIAILASTGANADSLSAGQLYSFCVTKDEIAQTACRFYIMGVVQGVQFGDSAVRGPDGQFVQRDSTHFCIPWDFAQSRMVATFVDSATQLITKYPDDLKSPAQTIVDAAIAHSFPCTSPK